MMRPPPAVDHPRQDRPGQPDRRVDVDPDHLQMIRGLALDEPGPTAESGVVDEEVERLAPGDTALDAGEAVGRREVGLERFDLHAVLLPELRGESFEAIETPGDEDEVGPRRGQPAGVFRPQAGGGAGDQSGPECQPRHGLPPARQSTGTGPVFQLTSPLFPMIIKAMAITRCPYCHAIIDENDKYCNNCGTQLLFSEDEEIEEEIPGEKIIEADVEEKDYTVDEPEGEKRPAAAKDLDSEIDEELEEELREETEEAALDEVVAQDKEDDVTEEVILVDEIGAAEAKTKDTIELKKPDADPEPGPKTEQEPKEKVADEVEEEEEKAEDEDLGEEELAEELEEEAEEEEDVKADKKLDTDEETREYGGAAAKKKEAVPEAAPGRPAVPLEESDIEYIAEGAAPDEAATAGEAALRPATFDSQELEDLGKTVELSKQKVDKFLEVMAEKKVAPPPAPREVPEPPTGALPPWASTMKGAPVFPEDTGPVETRKLRGGEPAMPGTEEEVEIFPRRRDSDSTMGLPEKLSQAPLPFERHAGEPAEAGKEEGEEGGAGPERARDLTPEEVVLPAGEVRPARQPVLPVREPEAGEPARHEIESVEEDGRTGAAPSVQLLRLFQVQSLRHPLCRPFLARRPVARRLFPGHDPVRYPRRDVRIDAPALHRPCVPLLLPVQVLPRRDPRRQAVPAAGISP